MSWIRNTTMVTVTIAITIVILLGSGTASPARGDDALLEDVTFEGQLATSGTVRLTATHDGTGIVRAEIDEGEMVPGVARSFSRVLYFDPPRPITNGQFEVGLPDHLIGSVRGGVLLRGAFLSETEVAGTATYGICGAINPCQDLNEVSWNLAGPIDTPPNPEDATFTGTVGSDRGGITLTMDPSRTSLTSFTLKGASLEPCTDPDSPLDIRAFSFETPNVLISREEGLRLVSLEVTLADEQTLAGTLRFHGLYLGECDVEVGFQVSVLGAGMAGPTPTSTPSSQTLSSDVEVSQLPAAGARSGGQSVAPPMLFALAGLFLLFSAGLLALRCWAGRMRDVS